MNENATKQAKNKGFIRNVAVPLLQNNTELTPCLTQLLSSFKGISNQPAYNRKINRLFKKSSNLFTMTKKEKKQNN